MTDLTPVTLRDPSSALSAVYVPGAGMIATSLSDGGTELLGQRRGLDAYRMRSDNNGLPIHGLLAAYPGWRAQQVSAQKLTAELDSEHTRNCARVSHSHI